MGFALTPRAYLRDAWNWLDFIVLIFSFFTVLGPKEAGWSRILRIFRTLRPLRMINRNEQMRVIIMALWQSLPAILNGVVLSMAFFLIFALLGLELFRGKYSRCFIDDSAKDLWEKNTSATLQWKQNCTDAGIKAKTYELLHN